MNSGAVPMTNPAITVAPATADPEVTATSSIDSVTPQGTSTVANPTRAGVATESVFALRRMSRPKEAGGRGTSRPRP